MSFLTVNDSCYRRCYVKIQLPVRRCLHLNVNQEQNRFKIRFANDLRCLIFVFQEMSFWRKICIYISRPRYTVQHCTMGKLYADSTQKIITANVAQVESRSIQLATISACFHAWQCVANFAATSYRIKRTNQIARYFFN